MRKFIVLAVFLSFTFGLNATITKEDIYNANPQQFEELKKELASLNKEQTEKLKKAYMNKELREAFKKVFLNKKLLKEASYAVIENGKITKVSNQKDADGISFWHEHSTALENPPAENVCVIQNPTWENTNLDSPCGMIKYRLDANSPYAQITNFEPPLVYLIPSDDPVVFQNVLSLFPDEDTATDTTPLTLIDDYAIHRYYDYYNNSSPNPERLAQFLNHQVVTDIVASAGYTFYDSNSGLDIFIKPYGPVLSSRLSNIFPSYEETELFTTDSQRIVSLKTGTYTYLLVNYYYVGENWWDGNKIILRWFSLDVQNNYFDVGVEDREQKPAADIVWNNSQISINLDYSVNPAKTVYSLYDIQGKLIERKSLNSHQVSFNAPSVANGVYVIYLSGENLSLSKKIVLSK